MRKKKLTKEDKKALVSKLNNSIQETERVRKSTENK